MQALSNYTERSKNWIRDESPDSAQIQLVIEQMGHKLKALPANDERYDEVEWCIKFLNRIGRLKTNRNTTTKRKSSTASQRNSVNSSPVQTEKRSTFSPDLGSLIADSDPSELDTTLLDKLKKEGLISTGKQFKAS